MFRNSTNILLGIGTFGGVAYGVDAVMGDDEDDLFREKLKTIKEELKDTGLEMISSEEHWEHTNNRYQVYLEIFGDSGYLYIDEIPVSRNLGWFVRPGAVKEWCEFVYDLETSWDILYLFKHWCVKDFSVYESKSKYGIKREMDFKAKDIRDLFSDLKENKAERHLLGRNSVVSGGKAMELWCDIKAMFTITDPEDPEYMLMNKYCFNYSITPFKTIKPFK